MAEASIENPIINTPFAGPARHCVTSPDGTISGEIEERRRLSEFFVPVARPRKRSAQLGEVDGRLREIVNEIRQAVGRC